MHQQVNANSHGRAICGIASVEFSAQTIRSSRRSRSRLPTTAIAIATPTALRAATRRITTSLAAIETIRKDHSAGLRNSLRTQ